MGCGNQEETMPSENIDTNQENQEESVTGEAVAIVNGTEITQSELDQTFNQLKQTYEQNGINLGEDGNQEQINRIKDSALEQLINTKLIVQSAEEGGYESTEEEITNQLEQITSQFPDEEALNTALEANNTSLDQLRTELAKEIKMNKFITDNTPEVSVSEDELQAAYDQYSQQAEDIPSFEEVKGQIEQQLLNQKQQEQISDLIQTLRDESDIEILI